MMHGKERINQPSNDDPERSERRSVLDQNRIFKRKKRINRMDNGFVKVGKWGECLWGIDENGNLLIDGGEAASLADAEVPWKEYVPELVTVIASRKVTFPDGASLAGLFKGCKNMLRADLSGFDTSNVSDMSSMFEGCVRLSDLDLSSFDTYACSDMTNMFHQCAALSDILLGD